MINVKKKPEYINNKTIIAAVAVIAVVGIAYKFIGGENKIYKNSPVIANVNGKPVYQSEADNIVKAVLANGDKQVSYKDLDEKSKNMIVREVAAQRAMLKEAKSKGIKEDDDMKRKVHEFKNKLIIDQFLAKIVNTEVTQDKLLTKYDEIEKTVKGKQQIKASHILLGSEDEANNVIEHLKKESFAKIAKDVSLDSSTKDKGGDLGYLLAGTMDPDFEKVALALKVGEVSSPVKTKFGWHVIKLDEKKLATVAPFDVLKQRIAQDVYNEALKKQADSLLTDVKIELLAVEADEKGKADKGDKVDKKEEKAKEDKKPEAKEEVKQKETNKNNKEEKKK